MKIAIIGSGISGLTSAWLLNADHQVEVFEKNDYIGGHTRTIKINKQGHDYHVDTGFIVFNDKTYPNFRALLRKLDVKWRDTEMSFSVRDPKSGLEYNGHNLNTLFAQRKNLFSPEFYRLISGILKFNKAAKAAYDEGDDLNDLTLGDFLRKQDLPQSVADLYLLPMVAAIWSASLEDAEAYPLGFFLRFFNNHGLLNIADRPQWHTVIGGSSAYIEPLIAGFRERIHLNSRLQAVHRNHPDRDKAVTLEFEDGQLADFDEVIFACHSDEALALLAEPSAAEREILGSIPYRLNDVVLHTDLRLLPRNKRAWASWNYLLHSGPSARERPSSVTYNMNILQGIKAPDTFCVTLNNTEAVHREKIIGKYEYAHPVYSVEALAAAARRAEICGQQHTHFTGAYWYNGFHEDGVCSAIDVAQRLGVIWRAD
ncbi:FAD-dependent oxidoreductase [Pseudidiomarina salinarum]|uniref:FAD-dependent oxidoreductase n=1 Tax=Pseudidiomarina salinarum TaxID=435908 RepID=A0A094IWB7_9GAMM|nr:FAD-dependent oxidoreductase [Pseudidiomarina salinarum]KFZ31980.1 FAD-dependent oxidoreductase [Pseudidiomarina salinarum]RUO70243.1 FAD-dependent oxidoreductase [Pseudidiomarina salinarum]